MDTVTTTQLFPLHLLPGGKERLPAVDLLGEGAAEVDNPAMAAAAFHDHTRHLHQLHGTLPISQCLSEV